MNGLVGGTTYDYNKDMACASERMVHVPTMKQRLDAAVMQAQERLAAATRARELFDKNPDLEELLNILQRSNF